MAKAPITARGRSRWGFGLSPPTWSAPSNPISEKMMPPLAIARRIDSDGPVPGVDEEAAPGDEVVGVEARGIRTTAVRTGTASLATVSAELVRVSQRMPTRFSVTKSPMRPTAATMPDGVSVPCLELYRPWAHGVVERYWMAARTSIGAIVAAWR